MNNFKKVMYVFISILTLGLFFVIGTKTTAATLNLDLDYKVTTKRVGGLPLYKVEDHTAVVNFQTPPDAVSPYGGSAVYTDENGDTYSFDKAFVATIRYGSVDKIGFSVTNERDTVDIYYGITTSEEDFKNTNNSTTGSLYLKSGDRYSTYKTYDEVTMTSTEVKKLTISFEEWGAGNYSLDTADENRLVLFGFKINLGTPLMKVTVFDEDESQVIRVFQNETLGDLDDKPSYYFGGYYLDSEFENEFDYKNTPVTEDMTLYSKWIDNGCFNEGKYCLTSHSMEILYDWVCQFGRFGSQFTNTELNDVFMCLIGTNMSSSTYNYAFPEYDGEVRGINTIGEVSSSSNGIQINAPSSGKLVVTMSSRESTNSCNAKLINNDGTEISATSGDTYWEQNVKEFRNIEYNLKSGGTYYIGGTGMVIILEIKFIPDTVKPLVQEAVKDEFTYVRFVSIVYSDTEINNDDISFSVTMTYTNETTKTVEYTPYVVKRITQNGNTYVASLGGVDHSFDNAVNNNEYYVVYVLRFTTSKFNGCSINAKTTYQGVDYISSQALI